MGGQGSGGYRRPGKPAGASGPGKYSQRTDGRTQAPKDIPAQTYGDASDFRQIQQGAPMSATPPGATTPAPGGMPPITGFGEGSQRPNEPVTAGAAMGAGPGPEALNLPSATDSKAAAQQMAKALPVMIRVAEGPYGSPELKAYVRAIIASL